MIFGALNINPWLCPSCGLTNFVFNEKCADWRCSEKRPNTMNHSFQPSIIDSSKCKMCKRPEQDHGPNAQCEVCEKTGDCVDVNGILMCPSCLENELSSSANKSNGKEQPFTGESKTYQTTEAGVIKSIADSVRDMDSRLSGKPEFFNAETISIEEIKNQLNEDSTITNKRFELAKIVHQRIVDFEKALFDVRQKEFELSDRQQAGRVYLNNLANQLTSEEREKVRLKDINYPVTQPKLQTHKAPSTKSKSNKEELREAAAKYGIDASAIQTVCVARNLSIDAAIELMKKTGMIKV